VGLAGHSMSGLEVPPYGHSGMMMIGPQNSDARNSLLASLDYDSFSAGGWLEVAN